MPSFTSQYLATEGAPPPTAEFEDLVLWTAGALYTGGYDTVGWATGLSDLQDTYFF